jgi:hypothetical protein
LGSGQKPDRDSALVVGRNRIRYAWRAGHFGGDLQVSFGGPADRQQEIERMELVLAPGIGHRCHGRIEGGQRREAAQLDSVLPGPKRAGHAFQKIVAVQNSREHTHDGRFSRDQRNLGVVLILNRLDDFDVVDAQIRAHRFDAVVSIRIESNARGRRLLP